MAFYVGGDQKEFPLCPAGVHDAWCYGMIDLGTQFDPVHKNSYDKVRLLFEIPDVKNDKGEPLSIGRTYTAGGAGMTDRSKLRMHLQSWRSRPFTPEELKKFDLEQVVGKACQVVIEHYPRSDGSGKMADGINTILPAAKDPATGRNKTITQFRPKLLFIIDNWDQQLYDSLPKSMKEAIANSPQGKAKLGGQQQQQQPQQPQGGGGQPPADDGFPF